MKTVLFYYDDFSNFEVACTAFQFHESLLTAAMEQRIYTSEENMRFEPHTTISELNPKEVSLLILPGGNPSNLFGNEEFRAFVLEVSAGGGVIAGICGGTAIPAAFGLLEGKRCTGGGDGISEDWDWGYPLFTESIICNDPVVTDGNIVTAKGQAFVELALELNSVMGMYKTEEEKLADISWWLQKSER